MNNSKDLLYRLLRLFPVSLVKDNFATENRIQIPMIKEILETNSEDVIIRFALANLKHTKQHIYLFRNPVGYQQASEIDFYPDFLKSTVVEGNKKIKYFLFKQTYELVVSRRNENSFSKIELFFFQPVIFEITAAYLSLRFIILERSPKSYLDDYEVYSYKRKVEDESIVEEFKNSFRISFNEELPVLDVNRGIKHLWSNDLIDAVSIKYKRDVSIATEVMDEEYTFKQQYPARFEEVMLSPLGKHAFRFLNGDEEYCDFVVDPTMGNLSFSKYPNNENQIENVLNEIIRHN